jgi:hypothetical protein
MNKKGIQLSVNFFVWLIIILVIFSGSLFFIRNFFTSAEDIKQSIDRETDAELQRLLRGGSIVSIPINKVNLKRGQQEIFWLGILNIDERSTDFTIDVKFAKAFTSDEEIIKETDANFIEENWVLASEGPHSISVNDYLPVGILVKVGDRMGSKTTIKGTYVFNVCVYTKPIQGFNCGDPFTYKNQLPDTEEGLYTGKLYKMFVEVI